MKAKPLHGLQLAFRRDCITEDVLSKVVTFIEKYFSRNQIVLGLFVDIKGAFDFVRVEKVIQALKNKGVSKDVIRWYGFFLRNRTIDPPSLNTKPSGAPQEDFHKAQ